MDDGGGYHQHELSRFPKFTLPGGKPMNIRRGPGRPRKERPPGEPRERAPSTRGSGVRRNAVGRGGPRGKGYNNNFLY